MQSVYMPKEIVVALENEKAFGPGYLLDENRLTQDFYFFKYFSKIMTTLKKKDMLSQLPQKNIIPFPFRKVECVNMY